MLKLIITQKHIEGVSFSQQINGAISRAAKDQLPDLAIEREFDGHIRTTDKKNYDFSTDNKTGFSQTTFNKLKSGEEKEIVLYLEENKIY